MFYLHVRSTYVQASQSTHYVMTGTLKDSYHLKLLETFKQLERRYNEHR